MAKMLAQGNRRLLWLPGLVGVEDLDAPSIADLTTAVNLSCQVSRQNFNFGPTGDDSINDSPLCFEGNATAPGNTNYEDAMDFYRYTDDDEDIPWSTFTEKGLEGILILRIGPKSDVALAAGQEVQIHQVITGTPIPLQVQDNSGYEKFRQMFHVQNAEDRAVLVA